MTINLLLGFAIFPHSSENHQSDSQKKSDESQNNKKFDSSRQKADKSNYLFQKCNDKSKNGENASPFSCGF